MRSALRVVKRMLIRCSRDDRRPDTVTNDVVPRSYLC